MKRYYAVKKGYMTGIFTSYENVKKSIIGYSGSEYKGFATRQEAEEYLGYPKILDKIDVIEFLPEELEATSNKDTLIAYVDGSYCKQINDSIYGAGIVLLHPNKTKETISLKGKEGIELHNVAGELSAAMFAMKKAKDSGYKKLNLHYDYIGIENWLNGTWKTKNKYTKLYNQYYIQMIKPFLEIKFIKIKSHSKNMYNDEADLLAKRALLK
jgi:ribonuclease HI